MIKARLLANAGLNEYIAAEIQAADGSKEWGGFAEAEIYASYGETFRAMRVLKKALPFYASAPIDTIPMGCWKILFPQPYWGSIEQEAAKNGLDPYMVASLIRQESEFNPGAISSANAFGLMQLLPSVGRSMAKEEGIHHFNEGELLNPETNIRLGTRYLKQTLDKFDGDVYKRQAQGDHAMLASLEVFFQIGAQPDGNIRIQKLPEFRQKFCAGHCAPSSSFLRK